MTVLEPKTALGIYSDASAVYINACILKTDGVDILDNPVSITRPYSAELREKILAFQYPDDLTNIDLVKDLNDRITAEHLAVAKELLDQTARQISHIDIIGYSGHLLHHQTQDRLNVYLGDGEKLAQELHIPVIDKFAQADMEAGGTGGGLLVTFMEAVMRQQPKPLAVISLSGITRLTYIGSLGERKAFDVGVGCLLIDRWLQRHAGVEMDFDGTWAEKGNVDKRLLDYLMKTPYLQKEPPKTLDRDDFNFLLEHVEGCSAEDGVATLTEFVVQNIVNAGRFLPERPKQWIITGGGTLNPAIMLRLKRYLPEPVETISEMSMPAYNLDAAGYGFLAVRFLMQMPITFPETTGVPIPMTGGVYHASSKA